MDINTLISFLFRKFLIFCCFIFRSDFLSFAQGIREDDNSVKRVSIAARRINNITGRKLPSLNRKWQSMPTNDISILMNSTGKPECHYIHATAVTEKPFVKGIDPTLFKDDDAKAYFTRANFLNIKRAMVECFFGNDSPSPWREKPGFVRVDFSKIAR